MPMAPRTQAQLTARAACSGMLFGGILSLCNIYSGLKVGFTTNMSVASALLGYASFSLSRRLLGTRPLDLAENAMQQTAASAAASIAGAGLVAAIPALTMLTGTSLPYRWLVVWVLNVSLLGVIVGFTLRQELIIASGLPFPYGQATAEVLREIHGHGAQAARRAQVLLGAMVTAAGLKLWAELMAWSPWAIRATMRVHQGLSISLYNLGFALDPSLLMVGVGALVGLRAALSALLGALVAWLLLAPWVLSQGWVQVDAVQQGDTVWFGALSQLLLWPGVSLMVSGSIASFTGSVVRAAVARRGQGMKARSAGYAPAFSGPVRWALALCGAASVVLQQWLFDIPAWVATVAVALSFGLAIVAGRVTGETGIAPIGAMGKITQLAFAVISPANPTTNLMAANVTGGAASQCADMLHDLKTGQLVAARPQEQALAQAFGVLAGAVCGSGCYVLLIPDPGAQLISSTWPAPAVAQWKAVAELFTRGISHVAPFSVWAALAAAVLGVVLSVLDQTLSVPRRRYVPSATSMGLAFVLPAYFALSMALGALLAAVYLRRAGAPGARLVNTLASGVVAGESLAGVAAAIAGVL